jgi:hypothetical protein
MARNGIRDELAELNQNAGAMRPAILDELRRGQNTSAQSPSSPWRGAEVARKAGLPP